MVLPKILSVRLQLSLPMSYETRCVDCGQDRRVVVTLENSRPLICMNHQAAAFCYIDEINGASNNYCDASNTEYPCNRSQQYYGRGPLQLTWNYNYGAAGSKIGFDGLNSPGTVATDPIISFKTALWFWMNNVHQVLSQGFGATIQAINGAAECTGGNHAAVQSRIQYYTQYCNQFGVATGDNLSC